MNSKSILFKAFIIIFIIVGSVTISCEKEKEYCATCHHIRDCKYNPYCQHIMICKDRRRDLQTEIDNRIADGYECDLMD